MTDRGGDPLLPEAGARTEEEASDARLTTDGGGPARIFAARLGRWWTGLADSFEREMEAGRGFLWVPVAFGAGILIYFALPREPSLAAVAIVAVILAGLAWRSRLNVVLFRTLFMAAAVATGVAAATLRTGLVAAPMLSREITTTVTGWIAGREAADRNGVRVLLRVQKIDRLAADRAPRTVRITIRSKATATLAVGDAITVTSRLSQPSGPLVPGGYDFAQTAFYDGIGGIGFAYGAARPADIGPAPLDIRLNRPLALLREAIRLRIVEAVPGDPGHIAAALVMGDQGGISEATQESMRASGLGHVLSISGLHMVLVAGSAFWLIRAFLALSPGLALRRPIKKWAAGGGLLVATFYLELSGAEVATRRAFIMLAIMFVAVLLDRRAITLRNVALAALVILVFTPESLLSASFQMSFAATVALVAAYEVISERADRRLILSNPGGTGVSTRLRQWAAGLFLTSLVAGLATAPFGAYHFQRLAPLTLLANLAAMPVVGLVIMPMALVSVVLMPFGLEALSLTPMKWGIEWMMVVAERTAAWSEGLGGIAMTPKLALLLVAAGFLWLTLWRERWRLGGVIPILIALPVAATAPRPDILVDGQAKAAAVRGADGRLSIMSGKDARFEVENWLRYDADTRKPTSPDLAEGVRCDALGCIARDGQRITVALVERRGAFAEDCRLAAVVLSKLQAPEGCSVEAVVIDGEELRRFGAHALFDDPNTAEGFRIEVAYPPVRRPYMPPVD